MKELYNHIVEVSINSELFQATSIFNHIHYIEYKKANVYNFDNFESFYDFVSHNRIIGIRAEKTFIFNNPAIRVECPLLGTTKVITKRNFKNISICDKYCKYTENVTIKELMNLIPAEEFVDWLKDRNIEKIVL